MPEGLPFIALEMEQAPASGKLAVGSNARTRAHLTREPMGP